MRFYIITHTLFKLCGNYEDIMYILCRSYRYVLALVRLCVLSLSPSLPLPLSPSPARPRPPAHSLAHECARECARE